MLLTGNLPLFLSVCLWINLSFRSTIGAFSGHSPILLYEQLKLAGAASGLPGDHGPAFSFSFISLFSAICLLTVRLVVTNPAVRCGTDGIRIFAQDHSFIVG